VERRREENEALKLELEELGHLANMGIAGYMIAHEINNLLTPIGTYAGLALENPDDVELGKKALNKAVQNCKRASKIMESILTLANGRDQEKENCRLLELVREVFAYLVRDFSKDGIKVDILIAANLQVWAVPAQIQQVLMNLILNAREAMLKGGGILRIKAEQGADAVEITLSDTGCGIEPSDLEEIFEPFFTTKRMGNSPSGRPGCGLGLAFCKKVVETHGGTISVESKPREGSTFKIVLPRQ